MNYDTYLTYSYLNKVINCLTCLKNVDICRQSAPM